MRGLRIDSEASHLSSGARSARGPHRVISRLEITLCVPGSKSMDVVSLYHCTVVLLYHCIIVSLYHCTVVLLYHCIIVSLYHCIIVSLYHCIIVSLYRCIVVSLYRCTVVPLYDCIVDVMDNGTNEAVTFARSHLSSGRWPVDQGVPGELSDDPGQGVRDR